MEYRDTYKDHVINAWTTERLPGRFIWSMTIDDERVVVNTTLNPSENEALDEAVRRARDAIDAYPT